MRDARVLDAGCGAGALAFDLAKRGASVIAVDISPTLIALARERTPRNIGPGDAAFIVGDMLDPALGAFDFVVAMDSLIHYNGADIARIASSFALRTRTAIVFTIAPRTPALSLMHAVGTLFPRRDRAPAIAPVSKSTLERHFENRPGVQELEHRAIESDR